MQKVLAANAQYQAAFGDKGRPALPPAIPVCGYMYDVKSGQLIEVPEATKAGSSPN